MEFKLNFELNRKRITISGIAGLLILFAVFSLPNLLAASLDQRQAERWIRQYLKKQVSDYYMSDVAKSSMRLPDRAMAERWESDINNIDSINFSSLEIKHFLVAPPTATSRIYVARVVLQDPDGNEEIRYFSLSAENRFFDFFWVNEHSRWMWTFSF